MVREKRKTTERPNGSPWHERGDSLNGLQWSNAVSIRRAPKTFESDDKAVFYPVMIRFPPPAFRVRFCNFFNNFLRELKEELASANETGKWRRNERPNKIIFSTINIDETKRVWLNDCYCYRIVVIEKKNKLRCYEITVGNFQRRPLIVATQGVPRGIDKILWRNDFCSTFFFFILIFNGRLRALRSRYFN